MLLLPPIPMPTRVFAAVYDAIDWLTPADQQRIFNGNAKKVFTGLAAKCAKCQSA
jgi:hypothetical protein